ncbi:hypothetical protein C0Q70_20772 [Pomacea canaliculata]|uniref:Uncharacterized protein n=1 Tax=Pomacea canaliculata TaxID=400727 RepID=A0A2T7NGK0_POMCA|nr:hypothetical protein C0Q70_20772 [Pomacea canaliculata]
MCLLFLNNIKKVGIYTVGENGILTTDYEVVLDVNEKDCELLKMYTASLEQLTSSVNCRQTDDLNASPQQVCFQKTMKHSTSSTEDWIIVSRVGFCDLSKLSPNLHHLMEKEGFLLPRGGVAVRVSLGAGKSLTSAENEREEHLAFCCLPLPVKTNLPVHVNGEFILDHETRRNIWENKDDGKTEWNKAIALQVIVPAYVTLIQKVKDILFQKDDFHNCRLEARLRFYESLFPQLQSASSDFWKDVMKSIYLQLSSTRAGHFACDKRRQNDNYMGASGEDTGYTVDTKQAQAQERCILDCLSDWSLIPVKWRLSGSVSPKLSEISLYPMKDLSLILSLTDTKDTTNAHLWEILNLLPLANLDYSRLPETTFASNLAASISNPLALLRALNSLKSIPELSPRNALGYPQLLQQ